jgi:hypothetical protein
MRESRTYGSARARETTHVLTATEAKSGEGGGGTTRISLRFLRATSRLVEQFTYYSKETYLNQQPA